VKWSGIVRRVSTCTVKKNENSDTENAILDPSQSSTAEETGKKFEIQYGTGSSRGFYYQDIFAVSFDLICIELVGLGKLAKMEVGTIFIVYGGFLELCKYLRREYIHLTDPLFLFETRYVSFRGHSKYLRNWFFALIKLFFC
jgi:hypothetical protein